MNNESPLARYENIIVQELKDEVLVCDTNSNRVFCLNQTASEVWKLCDGKTNTKQIVQILNLKLRVKVSEEMVLFSLDELSRENLLAEKVSTERVFTGISRREVIKRIGLGSMATLPLITSVSMPTAAHAQSCIGTIGCVCDLGNCNDPNSCCEINDVCVQLPPVCASNADCPCGYSCCAPANPVCNPGC